MNFAKLGLGALASLWLLGACTATQPELEALQGYEQDPEEEEEEAGKSAAGLGFEQLTQSLSSNPWTPYQADAAKARAYAQRLAASAPNAESTAASKARVSTLSELIAAERVAKLPLDRQLQDLQRLALAVKQAGVSKQILALARLQVAIAALQQNRLPLADFLLRDLLLAKNTVLRANALNVKGLIALQEGRVPEAVEFWRQALKTDPKNEAVLLNLGFISLTYGRFTEAQTYLSELGSSWFALSGLLVAKRLNGETEETDRLCAKLLALQPQHKPTLFNCGVHAWQSHNQAAKAKELLKRALSIAGGPGTWDTHGYKVLESIK